MTRPRESVSVIRRLFEAINSGQLDRIREEFAHPSFVRHDLTSFAPGVVTPDGAQNFIVSLKQAAPDLSLEIGDIFAARDRVAVRFVARGALATSGRQIAVNNINIYRLDSHRVIETWQLADLAGLARQAGPTGGGADS